MRRFGNRRNKDIHWRFIKPSFAKRELRMFMIQRGKVYAVCAAAIACGMVAVSADEFSRVVCDVSALPRTQRFVADLLASRIEARTSPSDAAQTLAVRFAVDATVPGENAVITVRGNGATVAASRFRGLV